MVACSWSACCEGSTAATADVTVVRVVSLTAEGGLECCTEHGVLCSSSGVLCCVVNPTGN